MTFLRQSPDGVLLECHVVPRASSTRVVGRHGDRIKVALAAPPVDGRANEELTDCISSLLGIPRRGVSIAKGHTSKAKTVLIQGVDVSDVRTALESVFKSG